MSRRRRGRPTARAVSRDGTQLRAEVYGPPEGQPVVLAHGWTEQLTSPDPHRA